MAERASKRAHLLILFIYLSFAACIPRVSSGSLLLRDWGIVSSLPLGPLRPPRASLTRSAAVTAAATAAAAAAAVAAAAGEDVYEVSLFRDMLGFSVMHAALCLLLRPPSLSPPCNILSPTAARTY